MPGSASNTPSGLYCRTCGYDLRAQTAPYRCPECGREFDPANRKTFLTRPPRGVVWCWAKRVAFLLLSLGLLLAMCWGWLYWGWKNELPARVALEKLRARVEKVEPLGGEELRGHLGSAGRVLNRVTNVKFYELSTDVDLACVKEFKWLQELHLERTQVTDAGLVHLKELKGLHQLDLSSTKITDAGLAQLKPLKGLRQLHLDYTQVTGAGLVHLKELHGLQELDLNFTEVTDMGLMHLKELKGIQRLDLRRTKVTTAGIEKLRAALPGAKIDWP